MKKTNEIMQKGKPAINNEINDSERYYTLMISTSWSTPLSPGNNGCNKHGRYQNKQFYISWE